MSCVLVTPRFRASRHVVALVLPAGGTRPALVAKVPRLPDDRAGVDKEAENLRLAQGARPEGFATIPRVVAFEDDLGACPGTLVMPAREGFSDRPLGRPILVETALAGPALGPDVIRRERSRCVDAVVSWLGELPRLEPNGLAGRALYERRLEEPLRRFASVFGGEEGALVERTLEIADPLNRPELPSVFEHGDLSHPNLIQLTDGRVGVVDWELAEPRGLPAQDLSFFLAYVAFATRRAGTIERQVAAFDEAFVTPGAWARPLLAGYADRQGVPRSLLTPLFVACWARYTARLLERIEGELGGRPTGPEAAEFVRNNRYYALWRHALEHAGKLSWE